MEQSLSFLLQLLIVIGLCLIANLVLVGQNSFIIWGVCALIGFAVPIIADHMRL